MKSSFWRIAYGLIFLVAVVFCIRQVHEPDLWWQLRTGEYILENGAVPQSDVFSFSYEGEPWVNVKWGFEVIQALTTELFGPEFLFLPQVLANVLLLILLFGSMRLFSQQGNPNHFANSVTALLFLVGCSYRMNGRPELISYLFTGLYIYLFFLISGGKKNWMWAFIPLQLLWANLHEGFGVGIVLLIIFCGSLWIQYFTKKIKSRDELMYATWYSGISILAYLSVAIHPMGSTMLGYPYNIFTQLSANQFTSEILSASNGSYWKIAAFINILFLILSVLWIMKNGKQTGKFRFKTLFEKLPLYYLFILIAFTYLSFKAYRNIPFFLIASAPLVAAQFSEISKTIKEKIAFSLSIALSVILYFSIVSSSFYELFLPMESYGIGIPPSKNSIGAANFIAENNIKGQAFTDYLGSAYLLWHLQPDFKTFVDLRDLDVFQADDMEIAISCVKYPERKMADGRTIWKVIDGVYNFDYVVVLNTADFMNFHRKLFQNKNFEPVYADELNTIYLRKTGANQSIIDQFGFNSGKDIWHESKLPAESKLGNAISSIFNPLWNGIDLNVEQAKIKKAAYFNYIGIAPK